VYEAAKGEIAPVLAGLYGAARPEIRRAHAQDVRQTLALSVEVGGAGAAEALLGRLPAAAGERSSGE
jgi:hypothetical protein